MNFSLKVLLMIVTFFLFHLLDIWPLPVPFQTLVSEVTTLLFFVEIAFYIYYRTHIKQLQWFHEPPSYSDRSVTHLHTIIPFFNTFCISGLHGSNGYRITPIIAFFPLLLHSTFHLTSNSITFFSTLF